MVGACCQNGGCSYSQAASVWMATPTQTSTWNQAEVEMQSEERFEEVEVGCSAGERILESTGQGMAACLHSGESGEGLCQERSGSCSSTAKTTCGCSQPVCV